MTWFRPFTFVVLYFVYLLVALPFVAEMSEWTWVTVDTYHDAIGAIIILSYGFKNEPHDKTAALVYAFYVLGLAIFDPLIENFNTAAYSAGFAGMLAIGGVFYFRRQALAVYREKKAG